MNQEIYTAFKAYDIRAESPNVIDNKFARNLGLSVAKVLKPKKVMVAKDMRLTSNNLELALVETLTDVGVDVVKVGLCSTPMFNVLLGLANGEFDLGIMVTASHNPGIYNGFKLTRGDCLPIGLGSGLETIRDAYETVSTNYASARIKHVGKVIEDAEALDRYVDFIIQKAALPDNMPDMNIVIDAGNGMSGFVMPKLLEKLPWIKSNNLYFDLDGNFPNHEANPLKVETLEMLKKQVKETGAVCGVAFDGDADRVGFVDENSLQIGGDILTAILGKIELKKYPGGTVMCDTRYSWAVPEAIESMGGKFEPCLVGHANIKNAMRKNHAIFSGELSMHFYYSELWNVESGDYTLLLLLKDMAQTGKKMSDLRSGLTQYFRSEELNYTVEEKDAVFKRMIDEYKSDATKIIDIDGLRYEFGDPKKDSQAWWFSLRSSGTEPLIRLNVEATTKELMERKVAEMDKLIKKFG